MLIRFLRNSKIFISKKAFVKNSIFIQYPLKTKQLSFRKVRNRKMLNVILSDIKKFLLNI